MSDRVQSLNDIGGDLPRREAFEKEFPGRVVAIYGGRDGGRRLRVVVETDQDELRALERNAFGRPCRVVMG